MELFNLKDDLGEKNNLADQESIRAKIMLEKLHQWRVKVGAKMTSPNPK